MRRIFHAGSRVARAIRHPRAALQTVRSVWTWAMITTIDRLPAFVRRLIYRPLGAVAGAALLRPGDHPTAAPIRMVALHEAGRDDEAIAVATRGAAASPRTAIRLARVAVAMQQPDIARDLLERVPEGSEFDDVVAGLSGKLDLQMGRYTEALDNLERAAALQPGSEAWRAKAEHARGRLALMDPDWRPDLPAIARLAPDTLQRGRILHLLNNSLPHRLVGYTVRAQNVARCQQSVGLDPRMVTRAGFPGNDGVADPPERDEVDGVVYERIAPDLERGLPTDRVATVTALGMADLIAALRPALLQPTTDFSNAQVALALGEAFGIPVVYEVRGFLEETWLSRIGEGGADVDRYRLAKEAETACMRRATAIVTLSETMRTDILARGGIDPERVVVVPNGVDVERFTPGPRDQVLAKELGIKRGETVIGYVSSFNSYEGIAHLIAAVGQLRRQDRSVRLLLVGDGDDRDALEAAAAREGLLADRTALFTGRVPHQEVERYYRTIDIFVVPRTRDRVSQLVTPLKPYEAMAMEKAVVVSDVGALLEIVDDRRTGRTFTAEDTGSLATVLDELITNPTERRRLGRSAREWVAANRTWSANGHRYLDLYRQLGVA